MAPAEVIAVPSEPLWDANTWEQLLAYIEEEQVVPIIGPASSTVADKGRQIPLETYVAERLTSLLGLPSDALPPAPILNEVVSLHLQRNGQRQAIYPLIRKIVREASFTPPKMLRQLAGIRQFNLYVTTAFDPLLEAAINEVRFHGEARTQTIAWAPTDVHDLDTPRSKLALPTVYHLFGRLSALPKYAISDEDLLEFLHELRSESLRPEHLLDELANSHLLIVGGNFSDWVARMFLRTTKRRRLSDAREMLGVLADDRSSKDPGLVTFLTHFSPSTKIFHAGTEAFVEALSQQCHERFGDDTASPHALGALPSADMPDGAIFISYAREDLAQVRTLKGALEAAGLAVWFDFDRIRAGDPFDQKIRENIRRCRLFLPVLSHTTETRTEGVFRREWGYALDRARDIDQGTPFIIPVAIDDTPKFYRAPPRFEEIHIASLPDGRPTRDFIEQLKQHTGARR